MPNTLATAARKVSAAKELSRAVPKAKPGEPALQKNHTEIYTYFTEIGGTQLLLTAQEWLRVRLTLETAGPVAVGTRQQIDPVLSGKGVLLPVGQEVEFVLPRGDRLFITAASINRVKFITEAIPWLQAITAEISKNASTIVGALGSLVRRGKPKSAADLPPCPPPPRRGR